MTDDKISQILTSLPCSIELPAGTGKTELIGRLVERHALNGNRSLVLTHTHAGVDVIRRRLKRFGVPVQAVTVRTIDSWSFDLISKMPQLSGISVGDEPDWKLSQAYHNAARRAVQTPAIVRMLRASYNLLLVDEYQDCQLWQHELIAAFSATVPTCVLGDRMQGLFFFGTAQPVDWDSEVLPHFPGMPIDIQAWRWKGRNEELGEWLLGARSALLDGEKLDLEGAPVRLRPRSDGLAPFHESPRHPATTVAISRWPSDAALLARRLGGSFTMIEEIEGKHLRAFAEVVDSGDSSYIAAGTVQFAIDCAFGLAGVFSLKDRTSLSAGRPISSPEESEISLAVQATNGLLRDSTPAAVRLALVVIGRLPTFRLYRREAWFGVLEALRLCEATDDLSALDAVISVRTRMSRIGRRPESRIVGRPLLIKGLEFEHAVLENPAGYNAHELYVVLSRASTSLTIVTDTSSFAATRPIRVEG
ncbi:UvrD-helicase domain-containing protein [Rathayibacter sp. VKM Ac-2760]|uniref:UvrD-helicase domain-containing protein n=1 Tax=Rathayibacter sp. VKM Ac-2760 TaxID=2609253 RepID=UPI001318C3F9|nr:UvrD-helicase domain-containing protein [Rathayibacter sp. VKM Ac-2760]QHC60993.1 UvrD-helicase domain-containing protein [Rathayibacter sp. VKM Ac-2760]